MTGKPGPETEWNDPRVFPPAVCVLRNILDRNAAKTPGKVFVRFDDGNEWTYAELRATVLRTAAALQRMGVAQGDHVLTWLPNSPDALRIWFAINYIGAVYVPMNIAWRGLVLENAVRVSAARFLISHVDLVDRLLDVDRCALTELLLIGPGARDKRLAGFTHHDAAELAVAAEPAPLQRPIMPWDNQMIIYTSGTTGPSKGVLCSYMHCGSSALAFAPLTKDDRNLVNLPLFHMSGTGAVYRMFVKGGSIALVEILRHQVVLGHGTAHAVDLSHPARRHGAVPAEGAAGTARPRSYAAQGQHRAARRRL